MNLDQYAQELEKVLHHECARVIVENAPNDDTNYCWGYVLGGGICGYVTCAIDEYLMDIATVSIGLHMRIVTDLSESSLLKLLESNALLIGASLFVLGVDEDEPVLVLHSKFRIEDFPPQEFKKQIDLMQLQYSRVMSGGDLILSD